MNENPNIKINILFNVHSLKNYVGCSKLFYQIKTAPILILVSVHVKNLEPLTEATRKSDTRTWDGPASRESQVTKEDKGI